MTNESLTPFLSYVDALYLNGVFIVQAYPSEKGDVNDPQKVEGKESVFKMRSSLYGILARALLKLVELSEENKLSKEKQVKREKIFKMDGDKILSINAYYLAHFIDTEKLKEFGDGISDKKIKKIRTYLSAVSRIMKGQKTS